MKRRLLSLLLVVAMGMTLFVGCGGSVDEKEDSDNSGNGPTIRVEMGEIDRDTEEESTDSNESEVYEEVVLYDIAGNSLYTLILMPKAPNSFEEIENFSGELFFTYHWVNNDGLEGEISCEINANALYLADEFEIYTSGEEFLQDNDFLGDAYYSGEKNIEAYDGTVTKIMEHYYLCEGSIVDLFYIEMPDGNLITGVLEDETGENEEKFEEIYKALFE